MPTNGSQVGNKKDFPHQIQLPPDFNDEADPTGYVGFEHIVGTLIWASSQASLNLFEASNTVEAVTLERHFTVNLAPDDWPMPVDIWAQISFNWPIENTTLSLYGDEALCDLYHSETLETVSRKWAAAPFPAAKCGTPFPAESYHWAASRRAGDRE